MTTEELITKTVQENAEKMREFHLEDMKMMREYIDTRLEATERSIRDELGQVKDELGQVKDELGQVKIEVSQATAALTTLLEEFKAHREKVVALEAEVAMLRNRLDALEAKVGV